MKYGVSFRSRSRKRKQRSFTCFDGYGCCDVCRFDEHDHEYNHDSDHDYDLYENGYEQEPIVYTCEMNCFCRELKNLARGTIVMISTTGLSITDFMAARFIRYEQENRCAVFRVSTLDLLVKCRDIKALLY